MSLLLCNTLEMEYRIKCLKIFWLFTNGRQKLDPERVVILLVNLSIYWSVNLLTYLLPSVNMDTQ